VEVSFLRMASVIQTALGEIVSFNPATGEEIGRVPVFASDEVQDAVARGREAFANWKRTSFAERKALIMRAREAILSEMDGCIARAI